MTTTSSSIRRRAPFRLWDGFRNVIRTRIGGARIGEGTVSVRGHSLLDELVGNASFFEVLILNITGTLPPRTLAMWVEASFACLSWPDPRIWCNGVGAFAGTLRASPVAGIAAGALASDSSLYGPGTTKAVVDTLTRGVALRKQGLPVHAIVASVDRWPQKSVPVIPGFARPVATGDERVPAMQRVARHLGIEAGEHLELAFDIHDYMSREFGESINFSGYVGAVLTDRGLTADQIYRLYALCVNNGVHACYGEWADRAPETFLPLRCDDIAYGGPAHRPVPG